jgi:WD40 repeat protein
MRNGNQIHFFVRSFLFNSTFVSCCIAKEVLNYLKGDLTPESVRFINSKPKSKLMIFVSSTFTDTHKERNILHEKILPLLRAKVIETDVQIILYDMRFGVKDENTRNHMTWNICRDGIEQCCQESDGLFFLSLQSEKYGYMPLPREIDQRAIQPLLQQQHQEITLQLVKEWYLRDENYFPLPQYELKHLLTAEDETQFYRVVLPTLRDTLLDSLPFEVYNNKECIKSTDEDCSTTKLLINRSVTEWETLYALHLNKKNCFWIQRTFKSDLLSQMSKRNPSDCNLLCDVLGDVSKETKLKSIKSIMNDLLPAPQFHFQLPPIDPIEYFYKNKEESCCQEYFQQWEEMITGCFVKELNEVSRKRQEWRALSEVDLRIPFHYLEEMIHHSKMAALKDSQFYGMNEIVEKGLSLIDSGGASVTDNNNGSNYLTKRLILAIIGRSGAGKTALMSKLFMELGKGSNNNTTAPLKPKIIRFCGTSRYSVNGGDLITILCIQILLIYQQQERLQIFLTKELLLFKENYKQLVQYFYNLLDEFPVDVFIDSLDQLNNRKGERSLLSFLTDSRKNKKASSNSSSRIIVSAKADEFNQETNTWKYFYFCEKKLKDNRIPCLELSLTKNSQEIQSMTQLILAKKKQRTLTDTQWEIFHNSLNQEPSIMYINLAIEIISQWKSYGGSQVSYELVPTVKGIINQLFSDLELTYGKQVTSMAFSFISFSKEGINDLEIQDCLSLSKEVLKEVFQYSTLNKFPLHVWLRIKSVIKYLIIEKENNCIKWFHRQLIETSQERYSYLKAEAHEIMAKYFTNFDYVQQKLFEAVQLQQTLLFTNTPIWFYPESKINSRRVYESGFHLIQCEYYNEAIDELCSLEMVCASALMENGDNYLHYLSELVQIMESGLFTGTVSEERKQRLAHFFRWIRKDLTTISMNPLLKIPSTGSAEPLNSVVKQDMKHVLRITASSKSVEIATSTSSWLRERTLHEKQEFDSLVMDLHHHTDFPYYVCFSYDGKMIASGSDDKTIVISDAFTGEIVNVLAGHTSAVLSLAWHTNNNLIASTASDSTLKIWDVPTGSILFNFPFQGSSIARSCSWNCLNNKIAVGLTFGFIYIIDVADFRSTEKPQVSIMEQTHTTEKLSSFYTHWNPSPTISTHQLAAATNDGIIKIWNITNTGEGELLFQLEGNSKGQCEFSWNSRGNQIIAPNDTKHCINLWNTESGQLIQTYGNNLPVLFMKFAKWNSNETLIAIGARQDSKFGIWDIQSNSLLVFKKSIHDSMLFSMNWNPTPNSNTIVTSGRGNDIKVWDYSNLSGQQTASQPPSRYHCMSIHPTIPSQLFIGTLDYETILLWDWKEEKLLKTLHRGDDEYSSVISMSAHPNGNLLAASVTKQNQVKMWGLETATLTKDTIRIDNPFFISWNPDGTRLLIVCELGIEKPQCLKIWDSRSKKVAILAKQLETTEYKYLAMKAAWNYDGKWVLMTNNDKEIHVIDAFSGALLKAFRDHKDQIKCLSYHKVNNSQFVVSTASFNDKTLKIWNIDTEELILTLDVPDILNHCSWNENTSNQFVLASTEDIHIFDLATKTIFLSLKTGNSYLKGIQFSDDGKKLISLVDEYTIKVWDCIANE